MRWIMHKLFVYGTLKSEMVQKKLLGHVLDSYDAKLQGYSINIAEEYYNLVPNEGGCVKGLVLLVSETDLLYIDQWEEVPFYLKKEVVVNSQYGNEIVYAYIKKDDEKSVKLVNDIEMVSNNVNLERDIDEFIKDRDNK
jgi:AIG2-like family.